jgi:hypothetical protein
MQESVAYQEILEEGVQKGITEAKAIIARNLLSIGIPIEQVAIASMSLPQSKPATLKALILTMPFFAIIRYQMPYPKNLKYGVK